MWLSIVVDHQKSSLFRSFALERTASSVDHLSRWCWRRMKKSGSARFQGQIAAATRRDDDPAGSNMGHLWRVVQSLGERAWQEMGDWRSVRGAAAYSWYVGDVIGDNVTAVTSTVVEGVRGRKQRRARDIEGRQVEGRTTARGRRGIEIDEHSAWVL
jgi:hypothetical protein